VLNDLKNFADKDNEALDNGAKEIVILMFSHFEVGDKLAEVFNKGNYCSATTCLLFCRMLFLLDRVFCCFFCFVSSFARSSQLWFLFI